MESYWGAFWLVGELVYPEVLTEGSVLQLKQGIACEGARCIVMKEVFKVVLNGIVNCMN